MEVKPGKKTTEFWVTTGIQIIGLLVMFGVVTTGEGVILKEQVGILITGVFAVMGTVSVVYTLVRGKIKGAANGEGTTQK